MIFSAYNFELVVTCGGSSSGLNWVVLTCVMIVNLTPPPLQGGDSYTCLTSAPMGPNRVIGPVTVCFRSFDSI